MKAFWNGVSEGIVTASKVIDLLAFFCTIAAVIVIASSDPGPLVRVLLMGPGWWSGVLFAKLLHGRFYDY